MQLALQHNGLQYLLSRTAACGEDCYRAQLAMVLISAFFTIYRIIAAMVLG